MLYFVTVMTLTLSSLAQEGSKPSSPGQTQTGESMENMPGMGSALQPTMNGQPNSLIDFLEQHATSGTDAEPNSTPLEMLMRKEGTWMLTFHGEVFLNEIQQTAQLVAYTIYSTT